MKQAWKSLKNRIEAQRRIKRKKKALKRAIKLGQGMYDGYDLRADREGWD